MWRKKKKNAEQREGRAAKIRQKPSLSEVLPLSQADYLWGEGKNECGDPRTLFGRDGTRHTERLTTQKKNAQHKDSQSKPQAYDTGRRPAGLIESLFERYFEKIATARPEMPLPLAAAREILAM